MIKSKFGDEVAQNVQILNGATMQNSIGNFNHLYRENYETKFKKNQQEFAQYDNKYTSYDQFKLSSQPFDAPTYKHSNESN